VLEAYLAADRFHLLNFEDLELRFHGFIERHAYSWTIPGCDADDVRQIIHIVLFECQRAYRPELNIPFFAYFKRSVINRLCSVNSTARHRYSIESDTPLEYVDRAACGLDLAEVVDSRAVVRRLAQLSEGARSYVLYKLGLGPRPERAGAARAELRAELQGELSEWMASLYVAVREDKENKRSRITGWRRLGV
jgi:hypothetical protein